MKHAAGLRRMALEQDQRISKVVEREQTRLRNFIRRRVPDSRDAEDVLQDVFYELLEANRLLMPIEHVTGWLFRVARNRITDLFRKKRPESLGAFAVFVAHELEGRSFKQLAAETGLSVNTLLSRKRYAVLHLRERLRRSYDELSTA